MGAPASRRTSKATSRKEMLLQVAERQFGEKGFAGASVRDIADAAGVKIGSIYNFFSDKRGLYAETLECVCRRLHECVESAEMTDDPVENLRRVLGSIARFFQEQPSAHRMLAYEMMHFSSDMKAIGVLDKTRLLVSDIVVDGKRKGVFRDVEEGHLTFGLISSVFGFFVVKSLFAALFSRAGDPEKLFAANLPFPLFRALLTGIVTPPARGGPRCRK
jgi:AcrR family transcriptional regulator